MKETTGAIIVIGNEILTGKSEDRNARFLIAELHDLGVALGRVVFIPDDVDEIARTVRECASSFDYVFTSGGIGPTHDDVTIEGIARAFDRPVVLDQHLLSLIHSYFGDRVNEVRRRMAFVPEGSTLVAGEGLKWPVLAVENVYVLPGVPEYFRSKFLAIRERFRTRPFTVRAIFTREDEFDIAGHLDRVASRYPGVEIGSYPNFTSNDYRVKITVESKSAEVVERAVADLLALLDPSAVVETR